MNTNEKKNTINARQLALEEIESLPRGSVIWMAYVIESNDGIVWHSTYPVLVSVPGPGGLLLGGDYDGYIERTIDDTLMDDVSFWTSEPTGNLMQGITGREYDSMKETELITNRKLAAAITGRGMTFKTFCTMTGLDYRRFWNALTGKREFTQEEIVTIRTALELTDGELMEIFFPEAVAQI